MIRSSRMTIRTPESPSEDARLLDLPDELPSYHTPQSSSSPSASEGTQFAGGSTSRYTRAQKREARTDILDNLRELVKPSNTHRARELLSRCTRLCATSSHLSTIMQEKSIENHTPLYWAIINKPAIQNHEPDLIFLLISHATPLNDATVDDVRLACLHMSDDTVFQKLRRSPDFAPLSGMAEVIAGGKKSMDVIVVEDVRDNDPAFEVHFRVPMFRKRMTVLKEVRLEFIAKGAPPL